LKYKNKKVLGEILGNALYKNLIEEISDIKMFSPGKPIIIVPIPLSKKRKKNRGYNQSFIIAQALKNTASENLFQINDNLIERIRETEAQAKINNRKKRLENIKGAFGLKEPADEVRGRTIIVLDDISTTGGTLLEAMKVLKKAGAKKVLGFAIAH
jgi:ComF family protein